MKKIFIALFALSLPAMMIANNGDDGKATYKVDASKSSVAWKGYKVTGEHEGLISITSGTINMDGDKLTGGEFTINMASLTATGMEADTQAKLEGHLKSDDFFGVASHPTAHLKITKVKSKDGVYHVTADVTIKEITHPVEFETTVTSAGGVMSATSKITIDRSKYNVRYGSNSFFDNLGDKAIYDNFDLTVELKFSEEVSD
ncbi:MAG: YceI family protein [Bacteroidetes bacterium]|nr:MAG: YceI family protein [Bacteroidota bacterium]